jgi:hypothetical protein
MKLKVPILLLMLASFSCGKLTQSKHKHLSESRVNPNNAAKVLDGKIFTYVPVPNKMLHSFTLKFSNAQDTLKGVILGPSPEADHGLFFYKAQLSDIVIGDSSSITFSFTPGELYEEQITIENYEEDLQSSGVLRSELFFKGRFLSDTAIILNCSNEYYDCYTDEEMIFRLKK